MIVYSRGHDELWLTLLHNQGHGPFQARHLGLRRHCPVLCKTPVCRSLLTTQCIKKQIRAKDTLYIFRFVLYQSTWNKISKYLKKKPTKEHSPSIKNAPQQRTTVRWGKKKPRSQKPLLSSPASTALRRKPGMKSAHLPIQANASAPSGEPFPNSVIPWRGCKSPPGLCRFLTVFKELHSSQCGQSTGSELFFFLAQSFQWGECPLVELPENIVRNHMISVNFKNYLRVM